MNEFTIVSSFCFVQTARYSAADFSLPACLPTLADDGGAWANERVLAHLFCEARASFLVLGLLRTISICAVDLVAAIVAIARAGETDWKAID